LIFHEEEDAYYAYYCRAQLGFSNSAFSCYLIFVPSNCHTCLV